MSLNETRFSVNYSNDDLCLSIGRIARDCYANKAQPTKIRRRELVRMLTEKYPNLHLPDTLQVNDLVRISYEMSSDLIKEAIVETIIENIGNDSVYNPNRVYPSNHVLSFKEDEIGILSDKYELIQASASKVDSNGTKNKIENVLTTSLGLNYEKAILGIGNADNAKHYARAVLAGYESMIAEYEKIKNINLDLINDFEILRSDLKYQREDIIQLLVDLLGDRAKQEYPDLFNFKNIEYVDCEKIWGELNLKFNSINETHKEFLDVADQAIADFEGVLSSESKSAFKELNYISKGRDLNQRDLVNAGVGIAFAAGASAVKGAINARNKSKEVVAIINRDVELIKSEMKDDNDLIIADIFRLGKLYSKLSDSLLPNYGAFITSVGSVIDSEFKPIYDSILENPVISKAKNENNKLIASRRIKRQQLIDWKKNIEYAVTQETMLNNALINNKYEYDIALSLKPKKPNALINLFTLGRAESIFDATVLDWNNACKPTVADYEYLHVRLQDESNLKIQIEKEISKAKIEIGKMTATITANSSTIKDEFDRTQDSKESLTKVIYVVKRIINASREVLETGLEHELINKATI